MKTLQEVFENLCSGPDVPVYTIPDGQPWLDTSQEPPVARIYSSKANVWMSRSEAERVLELISPADYVPGCRSTGRAAKEVIALHPHLGEGWDRKDSVELGDALYEAAHRTLETLRANGH